MYYNSKQERVTSDRKLVAGIEKKLGKSTSIVLNGRKMKMGELVAMIEARRASTKTRRTRPRSTPSRR